MVTLVFLLPLLSLWGRSDGSGLLATLQGLLACALCPCDDGGDGGDEIVYTDCGFCGDCDDQVPLRFDLFFDDIQDDECDECTDFDNIKLTVEKGSEDAFGCYWKLDIEFGFDEGLPCYEMGDNFNFAAEFHIETDFAGGVGYRAFINGAYYNIDYRGGAATEDCCFESLTLSTLVINTGDCDGTGGSVTIKPSTEAAAGVYPR